MDAQNTEIEIDLVRLFKFILSKWKVLLVSGVILSVLAFSIITASDSHGKDNSSQYAGNYTKSQLKFIQLWNEFSNISYRNSEFSRTFTKI